MNRKIIVLVMCAIASCMMSCSLLPTKKAVPNVYTHEQFKDLKIRDVAIVPFINQTKSRKDISAIATAQFVAELNKKGWYEVHMMSEEELRDPVKVQFIDAVIRGSILEYHDIEPLRFGIQLSMIDLETQETLWSVQKIYDANQSDVVESVKSYYAKKVKDRYPVMGHRLYLLSMNRFLEFVCSDITETLK